MARTDMRSLGDAELLERLLACSRCRDPKRLSALALSHFGGMAELSCATLRELRAIRGMDKGSALFLRLVGEISRRAGSVSEDPRPVTGPGTAAARLFSLLRESENEVLYCLCLDRLMRPVSCCLISEGGPESTPSDPWAVYRAARGAGSRAVIISHNHPNAAPEPSAEDVAASRSLAAALGAAGVTLVDHIVISGNTYVSLAESGFLPPDDPIRARYLSAAADA